jgi:hypothetical protein
MIYYAIISGIIGLLLTIPFTNIIIDREVVSPTQYFIGYLSLVLLWPIIFLAVFVIISWLKIEEIRDNF